MRSARRRSLLRIGFVFLLVTSGESDKQQKKFEGMLAESAEADGDGEGVESTSSDTQRESVMEELNRLAKLMGMGSIKPYEVLGVPVRATRSEIKRAYRRLSLMLHPDKIKDVSFKETATGVFMDIVAAHELLDHEHKRQAFDDLNTDYQKFDNKKTKDKERVAAWLESIKLQEYCARIIDYGYDSMDALDLADEVDVVAMTEDASIGMTKPHRPIFIKHWKCVLSWRLRDPDTRRVCAEEKRQEEDKNAEEERANAKLKALGAEGAAAVAAAAKEEAARRAREEEVARLKTQERERESQEQEREEQQRRSQEEAADRLRKEEEIRKERAAEVVAATVAAAAAEKEEHARKAKEEDDARQKAEAEDRAAAVAAAAAKEEAARRAREEEEPRLKTDAEQRAEKAAAAVRAAEEEKQGKEEEKRRLEGDSVRQPRIAPVDKDGVGVGKKDNASTMDKCFALTFYGLAKRSVSRFLSAMKRIVKPARGAQGGGRGGTW